MPAFLYRCPTTGLNVQGWVADDPTDCQTYEVIACFACSRTHLVNPRSGKVLAEDDDE